MIRSARSLAALASPERMRIVEALASLGACSVREVASRLGRKPQALYYHVAALVAAGLVVAKGARRRPPKHETLYRLVAPRLEIDPQAGSPAYLRAVADAASSALRSANRQVRQTLRSPERRLTGPDRNVVVRRLTGQFSRRGVAALNAQIEALVRFFTDPSPQDSNETDGGERLSVTIALHPLAVTPRKTPPQKRVLTLR